MLLLVATALLMGAIEAQVQYGTYGAYLAGVPLPFHAGWNPKTKRQSDFEALLGKPAYHLAEQWDAGSELLQAAAGLPTANSTELRSPSNYIRLLSRLAAGMAVQGQGDTELERFDSVYLLEQVQSVTEGDDSEFNTLLDIGFALSLGYSVARQGPASLLKQHDTLQKDMGPSASFKRALIHRLYLLLPSAVTLKTEKQAAEYCRGLTQLLPPAHFIFVPDYADLVALQLKDVAAKYPAVFNEHLKSAIATRRIYARSVCKALDLVGAGRLLLDGMAASGNGHVLLSALMNDYCFVNNDLYDTVPPGSDCLVHAPVSTQQLASPWDIELKSPESPESVLVAKLWPHRKAIELKLEPGEKSSSATVYRVRQDMGAWAVQETSVTGSVPGKTLEYMVGDIFVLPKKPVTERALLRALDLAGLGTGQEEVILQLAAILPDAHVFGVRNGAPRFVQ